MDSLNESPKPEIENQDPLSHLDKLDQDRPGDLALSLALRDIYKNSSALNQKYAQTWAKDVNRRNYHPQASVILGFNEINIIDALSQVPDPFLIFPVLEGIDLTRIERFKIPFQFADEISQHTCIPIIWGTPGTIYNPDAGNTTAANMIPIGNGRFVYNYANEPTYTFLGNKSKVEIRNPDLKSPNKFKATGDPAIVLNKALASDPAMILTPSHELGHVVNEKIGYPGDLEAIPALYGLRTAQIVAKEDVKLASEAMFGQIVRYNWTVFGTVAP